MELIDKLLCMNISPFLAEHDPFNSDLINSIKLESHVDYKFNDFLGNPNIVSTLNS